MATSISSEDSAMEYCKSDDTACKENPLEGHFKYVMFTYDSIKDKWNKFASELSKEVVLDSINRIYQFSVKSDEIERRISLIEGKFKRSDPNVEHDVQQLEKDIHDLQTKLEQIKTENQNPADDEDGEILIFLDPNAPEQVHHKVQFSNNIVRFLKGPLKLLVQGVMSTADLAAQGTKIDESYLDAVRKGLEQQKQKQQSTDTSLRPTFAEITSDWKLEGENAEKGYSSPSHWIRDPEGQRVMIKMNPLPICAANEWLAYAIGKYLSLPVNEVQISIYENELVTLHTDDQSENEKTMTFMDLPKDKAEVLLTNSIMEHMDIFDHLIQNVDRNQQNVLLLVPKTAEIEDEQSLKKVPVRIRLIDHGSSFGMGKLSGISSIAAKFHSNHLSIVKFDPIKQSAQFEKYLIDLPVADRPIIAQILTRFASITDEQFGQWIKEIEDFLTTNQLNRITSVLQRQRDIAKRYADHWGAAP